MPRAFRFTRRSCGGWRESQLFPAGFRRTINCKRTRETTTFLSWRPLHNRPAGGLWQVPRSVGNPASDTVDKTVHSTTLFQKIGVLRGETPKLTFAYFCSATKVGPRRVGDPPSPAALPKLAYVHDKSRPCRGGAKRPTPPIFSRVFQPTKMQNNFEFLLYKPYCLRYNILLV